MKQMNTSRQSGVNGSGTDDLEVKVLSRVQLCATPWTVAYQALPSMAFSRREYWSRLPFPSSGDLPDPGIEPESPALAGRFFTTEPPGQPNAGYNLSHMLELF